jgi:hypothetical protein
MVGYDMEQTPFVITVRLTWLKAPLILPPGFEKIRKIDHSQITAHIIPHTGVPLACLLGFNILPSHTVQIVTKGKYI